VNKIGFWVDGFIGLDFMGRFGEGPGQSLDEEFGEAGSAVQMRFGGLLVMSRRCLMRR
jgi:hypothetical protein